MTYQSNFSRFHWLLSLLALALMITACAGRPGSQRKAVLPTQVPEAKLPTETNASPIPATFTPLAPPAAHDVEAGVEMETAVDVLSPSTATNSTVPLPTQELALTLSGETEQLFDELDGLLNQIDQQIGSDDLSDLP